jgi:uncharacterized tellurite resistance protein B-like protein
MFAALRNLFSELSQDEQQHEFDANDYRLAAAALLVHVAAIDGNDSEGERRTLEERLRSGFNLDAEAAAALFEQATAVEKEAVDLYRFTSLLTRALDEDGRRKVVEMMWDVVYADQKVSEFEDNLLWRAADLLHVSSRDRIALRQRAAQSRADQSE